MPVTNITLNSFKRLQKDPNAVSSRKVFKVGNIFVKRVNLLRGLRLALDIKDDVTDAELYNPNPEMLTKILSWVGEMDTESKKLICSTTRTIVLDGSDTDGHCYKVNHLISPVVLSQLQSMVGPEKPSNLPPEYVRNELLSHCVKLVIIPFSVQNRNRLINYFASLGLDIEVSMVSLGKELSDEIEFVNNGRMRNVKQKTIGKRITSTLEIVSEDLHDDRRVSPGTLDRIKRMLSEELGAPVDLTLAITYKPTAKKRKGKPEVKQRTKDVVVN